VVMVSQMALGGYASLTVAEASMVVSLTDSDVNPALAVAALPNATTAYLALTRGDPSQTKLLLPRPPFAAIPSAGGMAAPRPHAR
jgi:hypothetical protein